MTAREDAVLQTAIQILRKELNPARILLFGSRATAHHADGSDFDLAVEAPKPALEREREIKEAVNESAGLYKVDIVFLPDVDAEFRDLIHVTGRVVYEKAA